jgi:hypothetical protein
MMTEEYRALEKIKVCNWERREKYRRNRHLASVMYLETFISMEY